MLIGLDGAMTPIDIEVIKFKVKVTRVTFVNNKVSAQFLEKYLSQSFHM